MKSFFYIPLSYLYSTRLKSLMRLISWICIYVFPTLAFFIYFSNRTLNSLPFFLLIYLLMFLSIYNFYEIGYIFNDVEKVKIEKKPTDRLTSDEKEYYSKNKFNILTIRLFINLTFLSLIYLLLRKTDLNYGYFFLSCFLILGIYFFYNRSQKKYIIILHFCLVVLRYCSYNFIFSKPEWTNLLYMSLVFPLPNLIERFSEGKFEINFLQNITGRRSNINKFRVEYYLLISSLFFGLYFLKKVSFIFPVISLLYLFYRIMVYLKFKTFKDLTT
jgi:hypothetical protein